MKIPSHVWRTLGQMKINQTVFIALVDVKRPERYALRVQSAVNRRYKVKRFHVWARLYLGEAVIAIARVCPICTRYFCEGHI